MPLLIMNKPHDVAFVGDIFLGGDLVHRELNDEVKEILSNYNFVVGNLESPVTQSNPRTDKPSMFAPLENIELLSELSINAVSLANNHIHDCGTKGILETIELLEDNQIGFVGAGKTIEEASEPLWIDDNTALFAFCDFDQPYLNEVKVADHKSPGVNPLRYDHIIASLNNLPNQTNALLYFHWGCEHVWFPPPKDIKLARKLLSRKDVLGIIGTHPHRPQGFIQEHQKRAYFSLGNFLFPNFHVSPKRQYVPPSLVEEYHGTTRRYHPVDKTTYKKWFRRNRLSLLLEYDLEKKSLSHKYLFQNNDLPHVRELSSYWKWIVDEKIQFLHKSYNNRTIIYSPLHVLNKYSTILHWYLGTLYFLFKQQGPRGFYRFIRHMIHHTTNGKSISDASDRWFEREKEEGC